MRELTPDSNELSEVSKGLAWAVEELPGGRIERGRITSSRGPLRLVFDRAFDGTDGYEFNAEAGGFTVTSARPRAFLAAILNLALRLASGAVPAERIIPRFASRLYKHEANITGEGGWHTYVGDLDEAFWVKYVKALVRMHFTGLVFYAHYHPFECFLDYDRFPEAPHMPARRRAATLSGLKRAFGVARSFGLSTFMQHYLTHFPAGLARKHDLIFRKTGAGSRLSALDHPVVDAYSRYVYRRTFEMLPELSGLYVNFESAPNSSDFVRRCLFPEIARAKHKVELVFRLWDFNSPRAMRALLAACPTKFRLAHKVMDRSDVYYYPKADPRVIEWKNQLGPVEWMFLIGPCHNCATAQSRKLWCDADFVQLVLADMQKKGADSFAFHTVFELLAPDIDAAQIVGKREIEMAYLNRGHLDAAVDYVRGNLSRGLPRTLPSARAFLTDAVRVRRLAERLRIDLRRAAVAHKAIRETSHISLVSMQQHFSTSSEEGYLYPERTSYYQDPFLFPTMRFANDEPWAAMTLTTSWLNRALKLRNVADDVQPAIDYANPEKEKAPRHPVKMAAILKRHSETALALAKKAAGRRPAPVMSRLVVGAREMYNWGMRVRHETLVGVNLFGVFFSNSRARTLRLLRRAIAELDAARRYMREDDALSAQRIPLLQQGSPEKDLARLRRLLRHVEKTDFPYAAFAAFAKSLERYNEIRRVVRPNKVTRKEESWLVRRQLSESASAAEKAARLLRAPRHRRFRANVETWLSYVNAEVAGVTPPGYSARPSDAVADDEGFVPLVHDRCFRYAENCIDDLDGFFTRRQWSRADDVSFRMTHDRTGVRLSLMERLVDVGSRRRSWERYEGTRSETFYWRVYVDARRTGRRMDIWSIFPMGRALLKGAFEIIDRQNTVLKTGQPVEGGAARFTSGRNWWRLDYLLPWKVLGVRAKPGDKWRVNVTATPASGTPLLPSEGNDLRNRQFAWCRGWEFTAANDFMAGKPERMGTITFV